MSIKKVFIISFIIGLLIPIITHGQVKISEIMYNPEGSDTKREWIEVYNAGTQDIDLSTWYLFENNTFHKLVAQANSIIPAGSYAIIVDSIAEVVADYADFIGQIFDSTFSLNNTGETISMANSSKALIDTVTYTSDLGANDDGNSLQITDGQIITAPPTFGTLNKTESEIPIDVSITSTSTDISTSTNNSTLDTSTHSQQEDLSTYVSTTFKIGAGRKRIVTLYTPIEFEADISKTGIAPRYVWNFGDFTIAKGKRTTHIYEYTGIYEVVLEGNTKEYTGVSRTEVQVVKPELEIVQATSTISIQNKSKQEVNIGEFVFNFEKGFMRIPRNTILRGGGLLSIPRQTDTLLQSFAYPSGQIYAQFDIIKE